MAARKFVGAPIVTKGLLEVPHVIAVLAEREAQVGLLARRAGARHGCFGRDEPILVLVRHLAQMHDPGPRLGTFGSGADGALE